jgi:pimeloyl-ACP methyl ester carboxylesterase
VLAQYIGLNEGVSIWDDVYTRDVIDRAYGNADIYASFITRMNTMKREGVIEDWKSAPYDWRLSLNDLLDYGHNLNGNIHYSGIDRATTTPFVLQELRRLAATSRTGKVTIIAHSNGGLVAKALLARLGDAEASALVDTVIFVASPQTGTPQAMGALLHGFKQDIPGDVWYLPDGSFFSAEAARILAHDMPGAYNLLPSVQYFNDVQTPVATFVNSTPVLAEAYSRYGSILNTHDEFTDFILGNEGGRTMPSVNDLVTPNIGSSLLLAQADAAHAVIDSWQAPEAINIMQIAGWGIDTVSGIEYSQKKKGGEFAWKYRPILKEDGDGTVVVPSALAMNASAHVERLWVNMKAYNSGPTSDLEHANILEIPNLLNFIADTITKTAPVFSDYIYLSTSTPPSTSDKKLRYFLHSPLSLGLYDGEGRYTGISTTTGEIENQIPGAYYREFGEVKYITTPASAALKLVLSGQASGHFSLDIQEVQGDTILATTTFADIPSSTSTIVTMDFTDSTIVNASPLHVDTNGDGTIDHNLTAVLGGEVSLPTPKPPLTVTANNKTIMLGASIPSLTATLSGFQNGDTATSSVTGSPGCTTTATMASPVGVYPITCTIGTLLSDKYNFTAFATSTLTIIYKWSGFLQPINDVAYNPTQSMSVFRGGSTVPVKFQLKNTSGTSVQAFTAPIWLTPQKGSVMSASIDESTYSDPATSGTIFKWDSTSQQYIYNWSTKGLTVGYWYRIYVKLEGGTVQSVVVGVR